MPRLHAILASKSKRIGELEHHLRETKETASREYERLKAENDQLEKSFMAKLHEKERESKFFPIRYDVMGGKSAGSMQNYKETSMFLCFHVRNYTKTRLLVFSPFSAYFYPSMDKGL